MDQNNSKETSAISIKLTYELKRSLGLTLEEKVKSKFIRKEHLVQKLQKLFINVPEVEVFTYIFKFNHFKLWHIDFHEGV